MNKKFYFLGILLLLLGLFWLHSYDLVFHLTEDEHEQNSDTISENIDLKFSMLGLIPTLLGLYLIEIYNKRS